MKKLFCAVLTLMVCGESLFASELAVGPSNDVVQAVKEVVNVLQKYGLSFDARKARDAAVDAMIRAADPRGRLMSEADLAQREEENQGVFYEVGIRVAATNEAFVISEVKKDSAAEKAGLKTGDVVQEIDKGNIAGLELAEVRELLRGPMDETVLLKIRDANSATREVEVKRDPIKTGAILVAEELPANLCYLKLSGVFERSGKDLVSTLRGWAETGRFGVILDLRGAAGADVQSAADAASLFAESGAFLFSFRDAQDRVLSARNSNSSLLLNMPAMILIDEKLGAHRNCWPRR